MAPPMRTGLLVVTPSRIHGGAGGGGGGAAPLNPKTAPSPTTGVPCTTRRGSEPSANRNVTLNEIGASAGGSYTHCRTADKAALTTASEGSEVPNAGPARTRASPIRPRALIVTRSVTVAGASPAATGLRGITEYVRRGIGFPGVIALALRSSGPGSTADCVGAEGWITPGACISGNAFTAYQLPATTPNTRTASENAIRLDDMTASFEINVILRNRCLRRPNAALGENGVASA